MLRTALGERLPDYMIPSAFVVLDALPLTVSGKLDRKALPLPEIVGSQVHIAPATAQEALLCRLYAELTGAARVSANDSFFALGGHSLLAMRLIGAIRRETGLEAPLRAVFEQPTPQGLGSVLAQADQSLLPPVVAGSGQLDGGDDSQNQVVLSWGQERLWTLDQLEGGSSQYNIPLVLDLSGDLDADALVAALRALVIRHEALRTVIRADDGIPIGSVLDETELGDLLGHHDLSALPEPQAQQQVAEHIAAVAGHRFDMAHAPSLYGRLLRCNPHHHVLALVVHHAAADGSALPVLGHELAALYQAARTGEPAALEPLAYSYSDHAQWQRSWLQQSGALDRALDYWRGQLADTPECLELPLDHVRHADRARRAGYAPVEIDAGLGGRLGALAAARGMTLFSLLLAGWALLLGRLSRQDDVVIGTPSAGRTAPGSEALIGFFVNTLALRVDLSGHPDRDTLLARAHAAVSAGLEHEHAPFEQVVEALDVPRSLAHTPLFQAMFAWQSQDAAALVLPGLEVTPLEVGLEQAKFDVTLSLAPVMAPGGDGALAGVIEYDADLFDAGTVTRWTAMLVQLLEDLADVPAHSAATTPVALLGLTPAADLARIAGFNATAQSVPATLAPELFAQVAARTPDATALVCGDEHMSYAALDAASSQLARYLIAQGAGPEQVVGLCLERSVTMVVAILAVLKSGAAYLPLDPAHPTERLRAMLTDSGALLLVCEDAHAQTLAGIAPLVLPKQPATIAAIASLSAAPLTNAERTAPLHPDNLAYLIYTSGSTGTPKGCAISNRSLVAYLGWAIDAYSCDQPFNAALFSPVNFDLAITSLYLPLLSGGTLRVAHAAASVSELVTNAVTDVTLAKLCLLYTSPSPRDS